MIHSHRRDESEWYAQTKVQFMIYTRSFMPRMKELSSHLVNRFGNKTTKEIDQKPSKTKPFHMKTFRSGTLL
jgi:hypothetical protein